MCVKCWTVDNTEPHYYYYSLDSEHSITLRLVTDGWLAIIVTTDWDTSQRTTLPVGLSADDAKAKALEWAYQALGFQDEQEAKQ